MTSILPALLGILFGIFSVVASVESAVAGPAVPRDQFKTQFETRMLEGFCSETQFVSHCYDVSRDECLNQVRTSIRKCLRSADLPKDVKEQDRAKYGTKVGRCVGEDFQARNKSHLRSVPECQSVIEWLGK